ncbi:MAG TPA: substrate-binding domain-containing protein [Bacteroidota bacterium]|nr:substrate-binding domain-containing protein [Bacteroidota bacterium]
MRTTLVVVFAALVLLGGCVREKSETSTRGHLHILIAESTVPPALDEVKQFLNQFSNEGANIDYQIVTTDQALGRLGRDSIRFVFSTRALSAMERQQLPQKDGFDLSEVLVAYDAVAVVVHEKNRVEGITTDELAKVLTGELSRWEQLSKANGMKGPVSVVLQDSSDITSYLTSYVLGGKPMRADFRHAGSSLEALQATAAQPLALSLAGITWVDSAHAAVKVLEVAETRHNADTTFRVIPEAFGKFFSPHPANVYRSYYPLKRAIYASWYTPIGTLATGFGFFVSHADGQRLFLKRNIVPGTQPIKLKGAE